MHEILLFRSVGKPETIQRTLSQPGQPDAPDFHRSVSQPGPPEESTESIWGVGTSSASTTPGKNIALSFSSKLLWIDCVL